MTFDPVFTQKPDPWNILTDTHQPIAFTTKVTRTQVVDTQASYMGFRIMLEVPYDMSKVKIAETIARFRHKAMH